MRRIAKKLRGFFQLPKRFKQKGAISILSIVAIGAGLGGVGYVLEASRIKVEQNSFNNYAAAMVPVVLRSELSLTQQLVSEDSDSGDAARQSAQDILSMLGYKEGDVEINIMFGQIVKLDTPEEYTDPKTKITTTMYEEFKTLEDLGIGDAAQTARPTAATPDGEDVPYFNAVALEIVRGGQFLKSKAVGRAIYGMSADNTDSNDVAHCYCKTRYQGCLSAPIDTTGYPTSLANAISTPESAARENYCMYGYTETHPDDSDYVKYPNFNVFKESIGHHDGTLKGVYLERLNTALAHKPLENIVGENQFPLANNEGTEDSVLPALGHDAASYKPDIGTTRSQEGYLYIKEKSRWRSNSTYTMYEKGSRRWGSGDKMPYPYSNTREMPDYDIIEETKSRGFFRSSTNHWIAPTGHYYVGFIGTCIADTEASDVPNISGGLLDDLEKVSKKVTDNPVKQCLSYEDVISTEQVRRFFFFKREQAVKGFVQTSCADYNRFKNTKATFRRFFFIFKSSRVKSFESSYENMDCVMRNMKPYQHSFFSFWRR